MLHGMEYLSGQLGSPAQLCPLPTLRTPNSTHWEGSVRNREGLDALQTAQPQQKHGSVGSIVLVADLNHSPMQAALKKLNSIPAGSSIALKSTA